MEWLTVLGAWLLFAGPTQQAFQELRAESLEHDRLRREAHLVAQPKPVPTALWLLPPVAFGLRRRRVTAYQREYFQSLDADARRALVSFLNKAAGWTYVAAGAWLIAVSETYALMSEHAWPLLIFIVACVIVTLFALANAVERIRRSDALVDGSS